MNKYINRFAPRIWALPILGIVLLPTSSQAFKLSAQGTAFEKALANTTASSFIRAEIWTASHSVKLKVFGDPVHEEITQRIFGCEGDLPICGNPDVGFASPYVLAGVRWNDDPPFQLLPGEGKGTDCVLSQTIRFTTQPVCWYQIFLDAEQKAARGQTINASSQYSLLARSHYGDLQFLHSMASGDGEPAAVTQQRVLMWAAFTWRVAIGDYGLSKRLKEVDVAGFADLFGTNDWRVQDLFTLGNLPLRGHVAEAAFGSLLHMTEDSFAKGHVDRREPVAGETCGGVAADYGAPGRIREFHAYNSQDPDEHGKYDRREAFEVEFAGDLPNVVTVGRTLRQYWESRATWEVVRPYLACVFAIEDPQAKAGPGSGFVRKK